MKSPPTDKARLGNRALSKKLKAREACYSPAWLQGSLARRLNRIAAIGELMRPVLAITLAQGTRRRGEGMR